MLKIKGNYLAAVSGGPDSMALLHVYKNNIKYVCHVNYHFRKDSDNDELLVKQACKKLNIKLYIKSIDSKIYQSNKIDNFEAWAREIRYNFFAQVAKKTKLNKILIGHHADDFLETALMQKNKSSHTLFYGIKQFNTLKNLNITRPFIDVRKKILINYWHKNNTKYCLDYTNNDPRFARNKIRKEIIKLNDTRFNLEINKFKEINNRNKNFINLVEKTSIQWIKSNHSIKFFKNIKNKKLQQELIYLLLINESPKRISMNKIDGIISFIISDKTKKMYRVNAGFFLYKMKNNILYLKQYCYMSVKNKKKTEIFLNTQSIIKKFPNKILVVGNIHKNNVYSPSLNRAGLELACNNKHSKFKPITSTVLWGTKESSYLNTLGSEHEKINAIKRVLKLKPPLIILCNGFKLINLVEKIGKKFNSTIVVSELHSHQLYMTIAAWINEQLAQYTLIHGTLMFIDGTGVLIQGESGIGKSEVALQLIKHDSVFIGDDAILAANLGNKIFAKAADTAKTFLEVRGIGLINIARMFGVAKIKKNCLIDMIITLAKSNDLSRDYFERVGEKQSYVNLLGVEIPNYRIPVTYGRDISILVESAVNDFKLKQEGYNSAVEFMQNYKHVIKNK